MFVVDSSGSIGIENWRIVLNFTRSIISAFDVGSDQVQFGMNFYGNKATTAFNLNTYNNSLEMLTYINDENIKWKDQKTNTSGEASNANKSQKIKHHPKILFFSPRS